MSNPSPDYVRVMRTAAWMWLAYQASQAVVDMFIYSRGPNMPIMGYHLFNAIPALIFLALSYTKWLASYDRYLTPFIIMLISAVPILINHLLRLRLPPAPLANLEGMILRQLPVLFIGLVLVAWHYRLVPMIVYSVGINLFELVIVISVDHLNRDNLMAFNFITLIRMVCFIVVGVFISQLITYLRTQQESLKTANNQLAHYASTLESLTVSRERNHMSRELHDTVVHTLSGLSVQLETAKAYWDVDPATARNLLDQSLEATRSGLQETRRAIKALRASPLDDLGLARAVQTMVETAGQRGRVSVDISLPDHDLFLSPDVEQCIYRITQEAVENVIHHANAQHLSVRLNASQGEIRLAIEDDGIGFNPGTRSPAGHYGLEGMQERAQLAGGVLTIQSKPKVGTTVELVIKGSYQ